MKENDALNYLDEGPGFFIEFAVTVIEIHSDVYITRKNLPVDSLLLAVFDLGDFFGGDQHLVNGDGGIRQTDLAFDLLPDLVLFAGQGMNDEPLSLASIDIHIAVRLPGLEGDKELDQPGKELIDSENEKGNDDHGDENQESGFQKLFAGWPGTPPHLLHRVFDKDPYFCKNTHFPFSIFSPGTVQRNSAAAGRPAAEKMAGAESLELTTCGFGDRCSTN